MRLKDLDLIIATCIASINVTWALLPEHLPFIGVILALPLVFVLPGYTLTEALFHKRSLVGSHRLVFSLGLSLAIDILSGLVLNILPMGLQAKSWAVSLGLLTTLFSLLAAHFRPKGSPGRAHLLWFRLKIHDWILLGLATVVVIQAISYSVIGAAQQPHPGFTQLWMFPPPRDGKSCSVQFGIHSFEPTPVTYSVTMTMNGTEVAIWFSIVLSPQEEWSRSVPIVTGAADKVYVEARLYSSDKPKSVYQRVDLTLTKGTGSPCLTANRTLKLYLEDTYLTWTKPDAEVMEPVK